MLVKSDRLLAQGKSYAMAPTWTAGTTKTTYVVVLAATVGGKSITVGSANLAVAPPPVKLGVTQQNLRQGRLLVLVSCKNGEDAYVGGTCNTIRENGPGDDDAHCDGGRTGFLDGVLTRAGVPHLATSDPDAFTAAFRSGQYNLYWITGGAEKLSDGLAEEIREAVNRGDGLLMDGIHDDRNSLLDPVVGTDYRGQLHAVNEPITITLAPLSGTQLKTVGRALKRNLGNGTLVAKYPAGIDCDDCPGDDERQGKNPTDNAAIVGYVYGQGKSLVMALDLVGTLQTYASDPNWIAAIDLAFNFITPDAPASFGGNGYGAARTSIANLGPAVSLSVADTAPTGASILAATPQATLSPTQAQWAFNLAAQGRDHRPGTRPHRLPAPARRQRQLHPRHRSVQRLERPNLLYGHYPLVFQVTAALDPAASAKLVADLQALNFTASHGNHGGSNQDGQARDRAVGDIQSALANIGKSDYNDAIASLLDAVDRIDGIQSQDMSAYRLRIDRMLQETEYRWQPVPQGKNH